MRARILAWISLLLLPALALSAEPVDYLHDVKPILARMDLNRDQSISLVEHRTATLANFDRMDTDKNGIVTPAEIKAAGAGR